jgi:hypothetical protein
MERVALELTPLILEWGKADLDRYISHIQETIRILMAQV